MEHQLLGAPALRAQETFDLERASGLHVVQHRRAEVAKAPRHDQALVDGHGERDAEPLSHADELRHHFAHQVEQARLAEENQRLVKDLESTRARVSAGETVAVELTQLKEERDVIRTRVAEMLQQLEAI